MKTEHKYAQVLRWIADGEEIQWYGWGGKWHPITTEALLKALSGEEPAPPKDFRIKPRTITVNGREIVAGESEMLAYEQDYCIPKLDGHELYANRTNHNSTLTMLHLNRGLVHLTKENAIAHAKAMLGID